MLVQLLLCVPVSGAVQCTIWLLLGDHLDPTSLSICRNIATPVTAIGCRLCAHCAHISRIIHTSQPHTNTPLFVFFSSIVVVFSAVVLSTIHLGNCLCSLLKFTTKLLYLSAYSFLAKFFFCISFIASLCPSVSLVFLAIANYANNRPSLCSFSFLGSHYLSRCISAGWTMRYQRSLVAVWPLWPLCRSPVLSALSLSLSEAGSR